VVVLYNRAASESESLSSFLAALRDNPELARQFSIIVYDNSERAQLVEAASVCHLEYVHGGGNGGLAPAYNYALTAARDHRATWLLLLDQDTSLTADYLRELHELCAIHGDSNQVGAIVPKLVSGGVVYSPESNFLYQMTHQFRAVRHPVAPEASGIQPSRISAYNSGAALRVSALVEVGGFPRQYWLDYLDHAVFHALRSRGYLLCLMHASLEQRLSHMDVNEVPHWRHRNVLTAQTRFVVSHGNFLERLGYRLYLLRTSRFLHRKCRNRAVWKEMLLQAFLLRVPSPSLGAPRPAREEPDAGSHGPPTGWKD